MVASTTGRKDIVQKLLSHGATVNMQDNVRLVSQVLIFMCVLVELLIIIWYPCRVEIQLSS